jgi:hypothetical protein
MSPTGGYDDSEAILNIRGQVEVLSKAAGDAGETGTPQGKGRQASEQETDRINRRSCR